ncbi:hypothetical protein MTO96_036881 [Rhipicephalus appendiculatus]
MDAPTAGPNGELKSRTSHSSRRASHRRKSSCSSSSKSSRRSSDHQKAVPSSGTESYQDATTPATVQVSAVLSPLPQKVASTASLTPAAVQPSAYVTADTSVVVKEQTTEQMTNSCTAHGDAATELRQPVGRLHPPYARHTPRRRRVTTTMLCSRGERNELISVRRALAEAGVAWPGHATGEPDALRTLLFAAMRLGWTPILAVDILPEHGRGISDVIGRERREQHEQRRPVCSRRSGGGGASERSPRGEERVDQREARPGRGRRGVAGSRDWRTRRSCALCSSPQCASAGRPYWPWTSSQNMAEESAMSSAESGASSMSSVDPSAAGGAAAAAA